MNVVIIEDEKPAAEKLERYLTKYKEEIRVVACLPSVEEAVDWLTENQGNIHLIFMDIQLTDGLSLEIFRQVKVTRPVVFTTAFNEFALDAFKLNGIDYLLKPLTYTDLVAAMEKLENLREQLAPDEQKIERIQEGIKGGKPTAWKTRFMVKIGDHIRSITTDQVALFYAEGRDVYLVNLQNRRFIVDFTLEALEELLNPSEFFRANRTFILNIHSITDVVVYSNNRLKISSLKDFDKEIIVSREKVGPFKEWLGGSLG
jgi:two-component system, LytTR family, response regulator